ncbi:potassium channel subfamily K member 6-like protein [Labeo rohita]|uniref:Potassium channel subfamily K member 6-like protein n=1 Tax=Labeo rohita TaxID=84645 RepID=A0A498NN46_LABRO|nr:potassium channel subfamily K member 6-like protein [Labeo rohita]
MSTAFRSCFVLSGFILAYFTYLLLGALVFSAIERPVEETLKSNLDSLKAEFLNLSCINATALEAFLEKVLKANKYGVSVLENGTLHTNWDLASSLFFANTMVTTVGLGDFVPAEKPGQRLRALYKISVMVYLFVGLMVMFLVLRTFHKLADVHGWTAFFQLPSYEEEHEDKEPIVEREPDDESPEAEKASIKPQNPSSQVSYNSINR